MANISFTRSICLWGMDVSEAAQQRLYAFCMVQEKAARMLMSSIRISVRSMILRKNRMTERLSLH